MTWSKYGDEFADEAAAAGLSDAAFRTHTEAIAWIYKMEASETRITMRFAKRLLPRFAGSPEHDSAARELCAIAWWKDRGPDWEIVHHASVVRESIQAQRRARTGNRERQRRHRERASAAGAAAAETTVGVTRDRTRDVTRDPGQDRPENHRGETAEQNILTTTAGKTDGRRYSLGPLGSAAAPARIAGGAR